MSESLKSWLFSHCSSTATTALEGNYDLSDLPYTRGNRIQLLRFLTFRPVSDPNSVNTDVWALVGDRTHCIVARFARDQVNRFHKDHPLTFTSLKGALLTLTNIRITITRIQTTTSTATTSTSSSSSVGGKGKNDEGIGGGARGGLPYKKGQYGLVLDVKGWEVVSSINEPVWFGGVKLVTSPNAIPTGSEQSAKSMNQWLKSWIRYKMLIRRAKERQTNPQLHTPPARQSQPDQESIESAIRTLPTPAQRVTTTKYNNNKNAALHVLQTSRAQNTQEQQARQSQRADCSTAPANARANANASFESLCTPTQSRTILSPLEAQDDTEMWQDFDLDTEILVDDDIQMPDQWGAGASSTHIPAQQSAASSQEPNEQAESPEAMQDQDAQTQPQEAAASDQDPYESGLSDYERESRLIRHLSKHHPRPRPSTEHENEKIGVDEPSPPITPFADRRPATPTGTSDADEEKDRNTHHDDDPSSSSSQHLEQPQRALSVAAQQKAATSLRSSCAAGSSSSLKRERTPPPPPFSSAISARKACEPAAGTVDEEAETKHERTIQKRKRHRDGQVEHPSMAKQELSGNNERVPPATIDADDHGDEGKEEEKEEELEIRLSKPPRPSSKEIKVLEGQSDFDQHRIVAGNHTSSDAPPTTNPNHHHRDDDSKHPSEDETSNSRSASNPSSPPEVDTSTMSTQTRQASHPATRPPPSSSSSTSFASACTTSTNAAARSVTSSTVPNHHNENNRQHKERKKKKKTRQKALAAL